MNPNPIDAVHLGGGHHENSHFWRHVKLAAEEPQPKSRFVPDQEPSLVILDGGTDDLGATRRAPARQDDERLAPSLRDLARPTLFHHALSILHLQNRPLAREQPGER